MKGLAATIIIIFLIYILIGQLLFWTGERPGTFFQFDPTLIRQSIPFSLQWPLSFFGKFQRSIIN